MTEPSRISRKSQDIPSFIVMDILEKAGAMEADGKKVIHFEIGEPDFDTPEPVKKAGIAAIRKGYTKYTHSLGLLELRRAIADNFNDEYGVEIDPERILVTSGSSNALFLALAALIDKGSEVIMSDPGYSCYPHFVSFLGGKPVMVKVDEKEGFQLRPEMIKKKITKRTCAILINSPANPTGMTLDSSVMKTIAKLGPVVVSDEIYHGLIYEGGVNSILEFTGRAFVINGFSKRYAMTGWRLGYMIAPEKYIRPVQKMQQNFNISANSFVQWAGISALAHGGPFLKKIRKTFDKRRKFLVNGLEEIGLPVTHPPKGAYYVFTNASKYGKDSLKLVHKILDESLVAITPGIDFGEGGEGYLRFSYANSIENMETGLNRLGKLLGKM
ncbi:MAG TPA: pyridoxal phosphate-dependent aminotransferase [Nitrospirae bacterium]|nr:pyridoxal phosphate-dependent aminotransferase [Nitrospirota bacterium]